ncbi:hemerythrin domain-containing protein [Nocardioides marmoribigeumensis]|uniref:Hemerythrin superfamily protein n=1 Tax=Nocardioides marmoribigeumensis TaxID=433649 RepID=A0ABU2BTH4_9ACTN|nr:hemerythrin domain-containing protein [Nocardioides marmoribigeumensis]MDR7361938.1 hemerythrin superfamily protein [Nocardioides marmoribigeumensis]
MTDTKDLPEGDVVAILLEQHQRIEDLLDEVGTSEGDERQQLFEELRALLAVHETAEEMVLRPVTIDVAGKDVADARNDEEREANKVLKTLEAVDAAGDDFLTTFEELRAAVLAHAKAEETEEFPAILAGCDEDQRRGMGTLLRAAEKVAPTRAHPIAAGSPVRQAALGPMASVVDRTRDAISAALS